MYIKPFQVLLIISLLFHVTACNEVPETPVSQDIIQTQAKITRLSKSEFTYGDTLLIYGENFGKEQSNYYIQLDGVADSDIQYLSWSDTLITVVIPQGTENGHILIKKNVSNPYQYKINKPLWIQIIDLLIKISLFVSLIYIYLKINKLWKRKHYREVAESQSLAGLTIYILNCILWVIYYIFIEEDINSMFDTSIYIFEGSILFLIGTGIFVKGQRRTGLWKLIRQSLRLERKEADYLLKKFFKPKHADVIINILHQLAMIDEELDKRELKIITMFAKEWNIDYSVDKLNKERLDSTENNYIRLRKSVENYIAQEPPVEQVAQLKDLIDELIKADDKVTKEEELISSEILPFLENYLMKEDTVKKYHVIIVPQLPEHENKIKELMPGSIKIQTSGGTAFSIGTFYSFKYADMICKQFRKHNLFTIVHTLKEDKNIDSGK
jgi:hypothetical protein